MPFINGFPYSDYDQINLDWVIKTCKEALDTANVTKEYVDNYFANLDVQQEINNKIQQMASDGELLALMVDTITSVTDAWLADNITNPSNPPLDATLTLVNAAAQSKATGDAIAALAATIPVIDATLTQSGEAADAAAVGAALDYRFQLSAPAATHKIPAGDDLNNYTTAGTYYIASAGDAGSISNLPVTAAAKMIVLKLYHSTRYIQIWYDGSKAHNGAYRLWDGSVWSMWHERVDAADFATLSTTVSSIQAAAQYYLTLAQASLTVLTDGDDLNTFTSPGTWKRTSTSTSVANLPVNAAGRLIVLSVFHSTRHMQFYITLTPTPEIYFRAYTGSWGAWKRIAILSEVHTNNVVIFGDSWSDEQSTPGATKWPTYFKQQNFGFCRNYAYNGSKIVGADSYQANGTIGGQIAKVESETNWDHSLVDTVFLEGGINDYRACTTSGAVETKIGDVVTALKAQITRIRATLPNARIIIVLNHELYVTREMFSFFQRIKRQIRLDTGVPCWTTFGWLSGAHFNADRIHPTTVNAQGDDTGAKAIAANMIALYRGGSPTFADIRYSITSSGAAVTIQDIFTDDTYRRRTEMSLTGASAGGSVTLSMPNNSNNRLPLVANVPMHEYLKSGTIDAAIEVTSGDYADPAPGDSRQMDVFTMDVTWDAAAAGTRFTPISDIVM